MYCYCIILIQTNKCPFFVSIIILLIKLISIFYLLSLSSLSRMGDLQPMIPWESVENAPQLLCVGTTITGVKTAYEELSHRLPNASEMRSKYSSLFRGAAVYMHV